jgi:hypothetical protein
MGHPTITGFIAREEHSVLQFGMGITSISSSFRNCYMQTNRQHYITFKYFVFYM